MSSASTTDGRKDARPAGGRRTAAEAADLVGRADELIAEVLKPGRWPQDKTVARFLEGDRLEKVLSLYGRAMRLDPNEPAYPWNLASMLNRLGLNDLALGFIARAVQIAHQTGDEEWSGPDAHIAMAEIAVDAGEPDIALIALARAFESDGEADSHVQRLLRELRKSSRDPAPQLSLARLLDRLPA